jgi:hypothetical protein
MVAIFAAILLGLGTLQFVRSAESSERCYETQITVPDVANDTGDGRYAGLGRALTELVVNHVSKQDQVFVSRGGDTTPRPHDLQLDSHLILWNGQPTLSFTATDRKASRVIWSEMAAGPEEEIAGHAITALDGFAKQVERLPFRGAGCALVIS